MSTNYVKIIGVFLWSKTMLYRIEAYINQSWYGIYRAPWTFDSQTKAKIAEASEWLECPDIDGLYLFTEEGYKLFREFVYPIFNSEGIRCKYSISVTIYNEITDGLLFRDKHQVATKLFGSGLKSVKWILLYDGINNEEN